MLEPGEDLGLDEKRFDVLRRRDSFGVRHLDGDGPVELVIVCKIDAPEAALPEQPDDAIAADLDRIAGGE